MLFFWTSSRTDFTVSIYSIDVGSQEIYEESDRMQYLDDVDEVVQKFFDKHWRHQLVENYRPAVVQIETSADGKSRN